MIDASVSSGIVGLGLFMKSNQVLSATAAGSSFLSANSPYHVTSDFSEQPTQTGKTQGQGTPRIHTQDIWILDQFVPIGYSDKESDTFLGSDLIDILLKSINYDL